MPNNFQTLRSYAQTFKFHKTKTKNIISHKKLLKTYRIYTIKYNHENSVHEILKATRNAELIIDRILQFIKYVNGVIKEILWRVFRNENKHRLKGMYDLFAELNVLLRMCYSFDGDKTLYDNLYHDFYFRKKLKMYLEKRINEYTGNEEYGKRLKTKIYGKRLKNKNMDNKKVFMVI